MYYGCLYIDQLYIAPSHRGLKLGKTLMDKAEQLARSKGCSFSTVSTMDWEAEEFYTKLNYQREFERKGYDNHSSMIFLRKHLNQSLYQKNKEAFDLFRKYDLPTQEYAITGSGPMGIRKLKEIGDIDIIVTEKLWKSLASKYGELEKNGIKIIKLPGGSIEAFGEHSFYSLGKDPIGIKLSP